MTMRAPEAPVLQTWPIAAVPWRRGVVAGGLLVGLAALTISPLYALPAALVGAGIVVLRRPALAGLASVGLVAALGALIVRRQLRYRLTANPSWPAAFDDLHRLGLLVVVLLLVATVVDECPADHSRPVA